MKKEKRLNITTAGELLPDGQIIELVRSGTDTSLISWVGKDRTFRSEILHRGRRYLPAQAPKSVLHAMRLPSRNQPYGSTGQLFAELKDAFHHYGGQSGPAAAWSAFFTISSWLAAAVSTGPRLEIIGSNPEALRVLEILSCVSRHPVFSYLTSRSELLKIPLELQPTLLLYAPDADRATRHFLRSPAAHGLLVQNQAGDLVSFTAPLAFYLGERAGERSSTNCRILLPATPLPAGTPPWGERTGEKIAEKFQPRLLNYRLRNLATVSRSSFDAADISFPLREEVNALGACIVADNELRRQLVAMVVEQEEDARAERAHGVPAVVVEAALSFCHEEGASKVYIGKLTERVNVLLKAQGTNLQLEPEAVGAKLRRLGIFSERLGSKGRGFYLLDKQRRLLHELGRHYDVPSLRNGIHRCEYCTEGRPSRKTMN